MTATPTRTATNRPADIECPKCFGVGTFRIWAHIHGGACFLCGGAKTVTEAEANSWLASQLRSAGIATHEAPAPVADNNQRRTVMVNGLGSCRITRYEDGEMRVDLDSFGYRDRDGDHVQGGLWIVIAVEGGKVRTARDEDGDKLGCNGVLRSPALERHVIGAMQGALVARAA